MKHFLVLHRSNITGFLDCFDRVIFGGYLPFQDCSSMAHFLNQNGLCFGVMILPNWPAIRVAASSCSELGTA